MAKGKMIIIAAAACAAVAFAGVGFSRWRSEQRRIKEAEEEEDITFIDEQKPPTLKDGRYYLNGDSEASPYWFEFEGSEVTVGGDIDRLIGDMDIKYSEEGSSQISTPARDDDEQSAPPSYEEVKDMLGKKLDYYVAVIYESKDERLYYLHINEKPDEKTHMSWLKLVYDYISETEFEKDGMSFKLAE